MPKGRPIITFACKKVVNLKTGIEITRPDIKTGKAPKVEVAEVYEHGVVFGLPLFSCAQGNDLEVVLLIEYRGKESEFRAICHVDAIERLEKDGLRAQCTFTKYRSSIWKELVCALNGEQSRLAELLKSMR